MRHREATFLLRQQELPNWRGLYGESGIDKHADQQRKGNRDKGEEKPGHAMAKRTD
jgi:hypothetical protein